MTDNISIIYTESKINSDIERTEKIRRIVDQHFEKEPRPAPVFIKNRHKPYSEPLKSLAPFGQENELS